MTSNTISNVWQANRVIMPFLGTICMASQRQQNAFTAIYTTRMASQSQHYTFTAEDIYVWQAKRENIYFSKCVRISPVLIEPLLFTQDAFPVYCLPESPTLVGLSPIVHPP